MIQSLGNTEKTLLMFIQNETHRSGFDRVVIGLSGGIDSAVSATLCTKALGAKSVLGVLMPYSTSSKESIDDALLVAHSLNISTEIRSITDMVDAFFKNNNSADVIRKGNVMARCRMIVLYDISARDKRLVVGTSNKTEILLGYGTIFGDMASAVNPIGDIYKTDIFRFAEYLGIPKRIIEKKPTADLWKGQTDECELGFTYKEADYILYQLINQRKPSESILSDPYVNPNTFSRIKHLIERNQFKKNPPIIQKVSD